MALLDKALEDFFGLDRCRAPVCMYFVDTVGRSLLF